MISSRNNVTLKVKSIDSSMAYRVGTEINIFYRNEVVGAITGRLFNFLKAYNHTED